MLQRDAERAAFYALRPGGARDYLTLLHLPYTAWHLAYVGIGAGLASTLDGGRLAWTLAAFFLAVGVAAHCLDELRGRPLGTHVPGWVLIALASAALAGAVAIGVAGIGVVGSPLAVFVALGVLLVLGYNLELGGGRLHTDEGFALAWGAFPVLVGGFAQTGRIGLPLAAAALFATATSLAQRRLSTWVRALRRRAGHVEGTIGWLDGSSQALDLPTLVAPAEGALRLLAAAHVLLALALLARHA